MGKDLLTKPYRVLFFDELEDYKLAIKKLTEYLKSHPQSGIAYNNRGLAHSEVGESDEAFRDFAEAMRDTPLTTQFLISTAATFICDTRNVGT